LIKQPFSFRKRKALTEKKKNIGLEKEYRELK